MTLRFDVDASPSLAPEQKERIRTQLATRIDKHGVLRVTSQRHRSQAANRDEATSRFAELLRQALEEDAERVPTRVSPRQRRRRLRAKRRRGEIKRLRREHPAGDD